MIGPSRRPHCGHRIIHAPRLTPNRISAPAASASGVGVTIPKASATGKPTAPSHARRPATGTLMRTPGRDRRTPGTDDACPPCLRCICSSDYTRGESFIESESRAIVTQIDDGFQAEIVASHGLLIGLSGRLRAAHFDPETVGEIPQAAGGLVSFRPYVVGSRKTIA